jgi:hypothetical protein
MPGRSVVRLNPLHNTILLFLFVITFCAAPLCAARDLNVEETHSDARDFVAGGFVHVRLSVGDMHIRRGDSNKISLRYTVKSRHERNVKDAHVDFDVRGKDATIEFHTHSGSNAQFDVELEVPEKTNLDVHAKVGDVTVEDVQGDKDLTLGVGDIRVANGSEGYRLINASAGIGDVSGEGYGKISGWLGKTLKYRGEGKYELRAHVGVGDIRLEGK